MATYRVIVTCTFGLESVLKNELYHLGYDNLTVKDGHIEFSATELGIARCNIFLRTADRVLLKLNEFKCDDFDLLYDGTAAVPWAEFLPEDANIHVIGRSLKSKLASVPACQSIVKRCIIDQMTKKYHITQFLERGDEYKIEIAIKDNLATLTLDTTGEGLFKRGYRTKAGAAPLKETLAAGLVYLSGWKPDQFLVDPFCGSATILIEAALIARNQAPGLERRFAAQEYGFLPKTIWREAGQEALDLINNNRLFIFGSDNDQDVLDIANQNLKNIEMDEIIRLDCRDFAERQFFKGEGVVITNPPYGARLSDEESLQELYKMMGKKFVQSDSWSYHILTAFETFQETFGRAANKKRKLFNGNLKCHFYNYFAPRKEKIRIEE